MRYMRFRDVVYLIIKPFLGQKQGPTKNEVLSRAVEHGALKEAAANLTTVPDNLLSAAVEDRKAVGSRSRRIASADSRRPSVLLNRGKLF